jgi:hypothetical protein
VPFANTNAEAGDGRDGNRGPKGHSQIDQERDNMRQLMSGDEIINSDEPVESDGKSDDWYRDRAKELYCVDGEIEVDSNARISRGDDRGAYVEAWVWVPDDEDLTDD